MLWIRLAVISSFLFTGALPFTALPTPAQSSSTPSLSSGQGPTSEQKELEQLTEEEYRLLVLGTQIYLGRFGYGVGPFTGELDDKTQKALREYQKYVGIPETGTINKETLKHLTDDNTTLDQLLPFLPKFRFSDLNWNDTFTAEGTWAMENLPVAGALQTSEISCFKKWNICTESTAKLVPGYTPTLVSHANVFGIETWDDTHIITQASATGPCLLTTIHIDRKDKMVKRNTTVTPSNTKPCDKASARTIEMKLADGSQIYVALKQRKNQNAQRILRVRDLATAKEQRASKP